ncbi:stretch-activated cation channel mid1 [Cadophora gregata]|uniref:stretch-activated cation channel mid1 n=1 Tax=Cadophora gregata TaxID=51156 RepID=UPI0026DAD085|nr:stretch-activated cation channel mid1 [Cadophora gregata]KAK0108664.1 stretch-activated cation channel mid1 [Cadophora gregata]KAK0108746.1 stretch-activated cation channel mid1 [Cadophora gregata f. sp. sojae]
MDESVKSEIERTWGFLFATASRREVRKKDYPLVYWGNLMLQALGPFSDLYEQLKCYKNIQSMHLGDPTSSLNYEVTLQAALSKRLVSYSQFGVFQTRLRQLRHYMDSQKPRGIRQLWKDKRDTLNYYTFWAVIIFGSLSIFLAFFSLAVSIAQTVASFKALSAT